ncbi:MAG TPA: hypothetical protein VGU01_15230 [Sphingomicrobium sp.]|nr:hypothetical protein [Sphingomicrobium sp.]
MARAANCPPWRHAVFGLLMGGLVASPAFEIKIRFAVLAVLLGCIPLIMHSDRKRMGMFVNGYRRGKTRLVALGVLIVELALYFGSVRFALSLNDRTTPLLLGLAAIVIGIGGSLIWQRVFVRELSA